MSEGYSIGAHLNKIALLSGCRTYNWLNRRPGFSRAATRAAAPSVMVEVQGATSQIASGITPGYGVNEACGEDATANSLYHQSYEVIFRRTYEDR